MFYRILIEDCEKIKSRENFAEFIVREFGKTL